jgi:hypothetical protein
VWAKEVEDVHREDCANLQVDRRLPMDMTAESSAAGVPYYSESDDE